MAHKLRNYGIEINGEWFIEPQNDSNDERPLRCTFDVSVSPGDSLAYADIRIYNLAGAKSGDNYNTKLPVAGSQIRLNAGWTIYDSNGFATQEFRDFIFTGIIKNIIRERDGANNVTHLYCSTLGTVKDLPLTTSSYAPGVNLLDVLKDLAQTWGKTLVCNESDFSSITMTSGYVTHNDVLKEFKTLANSYGFSILVDRGTVTCQYDDKDRKKTADFLLSAATGLIGVPDVSLADALGATATCTLNPYVRASSVFEIKSDYATVNNGANLFTNTQPNTTANGIYNVQAFRHRGDTHGYIWQTEIDGLKPGTTTNFSNDGKLAWGTKVDQAFRDKVRQVAKNLNIDPSWLMAIMYHESGLSTTARNPLSTATGLIQFTRATATSIGTTTTALARMTAIEQMDYVQKYFEQYKLHLTNLSDCYMAVFYPRAMGQPDSFIIATQGTSVYNSNAGLDVNRDGTITKAEAVAPVMRSLMNGQQNAF